MRQEIRNAFHGSRFWIAVITMLLCFLGFLLPEKKRLCILSACMTLALLICTTVTALAEPKYVSIREIRESLPARWTGDYTVKKGDGKHIKNGDTISIDAPIIVPEVEAVPVVRITWGGPYEDIDGSLQMSENSRNRFEFKHNTPESAEVGSIIEQNVSINEKLSWDDAPSVLLEQLRKTIPSMNDKTLEPFYRVVRGNAEQDRRYYTLYYTSFHGIPYLVGNVFRLGVDSERGSHQADDEPTVPFNITYSSIIDPDRFSASICAPKEISIEREDVPLLPFVKIREIFEKRVTDGYVYSLSEIRFGYMVYIDPEKKGEEYILCPVWAAKGITRSDVGHLFRPNVDQNTLDYNGYNSKRIIVVNAQNGEVYDFDDCSCLFSTHNTDTTINIAKA